MASNTVCASATIGPKLHTGGCHCGAIRYQVTIDTRNGSRCLLDLQQGRSAGRHGGAAAFGLLAGADSSTEYAWRTKTASRVFCKYCGVHCFGRGHIPELGGEFVSINYNTLDGRRPEPGERGVLGRPTRQLSCGAESYHAGPRATPWPIAGETASSRRRKAAGRVGNQR